ncbi:hypothetical protein AB0O76_38965 [Streptomyces sp. NPDC086554]|uniref:hypothetical protein n=1 Tax=Streptomyces sp. NPDC086554 TaxID=3154864 RepID=UPI00342F4634
MVPEAGPRVFLAPGDIALVRGRAPYALADSPDTAPQILRRPRGRSMARTLQYLCVRLRWPGCPGCMTELMRRNWTSRGKEVSSHVTRPRPQLLHLARRLRHR